MTLADFIERNRETILAEWVAFAGTMLPAADDMVASELRDHAPKILEAISKDLRSRQSREAQYEKSQGRAPVVEDAPDTAAEIHAVLRARSGFDINQLVAEYRALRASVLRLWIDNGTIDRSSIDDMRRFNEAVDQAIAESVSHFHTEVETARNLLLGMLGHDMRSPLSTIVTTASGLQLMDAGPVVSAAADRLVRGAQSLRSLLDDLIDFSRTRLGLGLRIAPVQVDLSQVISGELEQLRGAHPERSVHLTIEGDTAGQFDGRRVQQVLRNLVSNAMLYGAPAMPVRVMLRGVPDAVHLVVANNGPTINDQTADEMFLALKRGSPHGDGLGLGLFIVTAITEAHKGKVTFSSLDGETSFDVQLPKIPVSR